MGMTSGMTPTSMGVVRPMSPSSNFTTCSLPPGDQELDGASDPVQDTSGNPKGGGGGGRALGAIRQLLNCSSPCFRHGHQHSIELGQEDNSPILARHNNDNVHGSSAAVEREVRGDAEDLRLRMEMQSVLRHLEVRWQLFNEALSKFGDLDAMLAICADSKGRWRCYNKLGGTAKDARLVDVLQSFIDRKLSMDVFINKVTQLLPSGRKGLTLDSYGSWGQLQPAYDSGAAVTQAALEEVLQDFETGQIGISDNNIEHRSSSKPRVLEEDCYTLCDQKGNVVEEGKQVVIWEQRNAIWYIHGCLSYPSTAL